MYVVLEVRPTVFHFELLYLKMAETLQCVQYVAKDIIQCPSLPWYYHPSQVILSYVICTGTLHLYLILMSPVT